MSIAITFNGTTIEGAQGWEEDDDSRLSSVTIPKRAGIYFDPIPVAEARGISIKGSLIRSTPELLRTALDELQASLNVGRAELQLHDDRFVYAAKESFKIKYLRGYAGRGIQYDLKFLSDDPFWYATTPVVVTATVSGSTTVTITPTGNAPTPILIEHVPSGSMTNFKITNSNLNVLRFLEFTGTVGAGTKLAIDTNALTCRNDGTNALSSLTGSMFNLLGAAGNPLDITGTGINGAFQVTYRDRWF